MTSLEQIQEFLHFLGDAILIVNKSSQIVFANSACAKLFDYSQSQITQLSMDELMEPQFRQQHRGLVETYIESSSPVVEMMQRRIIPCKNSTGRVFQARISIANIILNGESFGIATIQDYSEVQQQLSTLEHESIIDQLTGLYNRRYLARIIEPNSRTLNSWKRVGVLYLDLDHFKPINDRYGHEVGDRVLQEVSGRLRQTFRHEDIIFRVGGDEFLILISINTSGNTAQVLNDICKKLQHSITRPIMLKNCSVNVGVSMGCGVYPDDNSELTELINLADRAMYGSKSSGDSVVYVNQ